jgi:hypothetical protein
MRDQFSPLFLLQLLLPLFDLKRLLVMNYRFEKVAGCVRRRTIAKIIADRLIRDEWRRRRRRRDSILRHVGADPARQSKQSDRDKNRKSQHH